MGHGVGGAGGGRWGSIHMIRSEYTKVISGSDTVCAYIFAGFNIRRLHIYTIFTDYIFADEGC